jgi:hypothetical protein
MKSNPDHFQCLSEYKEVALLQLRQNKLYHTIISKGNTNDELVERALGHEQCFVSTQDDQVQVLVCVQYI